MFEKIENLLKIGCKWRYKQLIYKIKKIKIDEFEKSYHCDFANCQKAYKTWMCLQRHRSMHYKADDDRPYLCDWDECPAQFKKLKNLIVHRRKHTGVRPFKCDYSECGKRFRSSHSLTYHRKLHLKFDLNKIK